MTIITFKRIFLKEIVSIFVLNFDVGTNILQLKFL